MVNAFSERNQELLLMINGGADAVGHGLELV